MSSDSKQALACLAQTANFHRPVEISKLGTSIAAEFDRIAKLESEAALRAVLVGITLHRIKYHLPHGEWMPWQKAHLDLKKTQVNNYMRLATAFVARARATKQELLALPAAGQKKTLALDSKTPVGRAFAEKLNKFVGDCSLNELLVKYGIKGVTRDGDAGTETGTGETPATGADGQMFFAEIAEHFVGIRQILDPAKVAQFTPAQLDQMKTELASLNAEFDRIYRQARSQ